MQLLLESLFNGVAIGSVLLMAALGLAIVFGLMGVINLAHGELIMLGAYTTYVVQLIFKLPALQPVYNAYVLVALPLASSSAVWSASCWNCLLYTSDAADD